MTGSRGGRPGRPGDAVLVTGSSTGLGLETALHLAGAGSASSPPCATRRRARGRAQAAADARRGARRAAARPHRRRLASPRRSRPSPSAPGGVFGLVNNGGIGLRGAVEDCTEDEIRRVFETNVIGTIAVTKAVLPAHARGALRADRDGLLDRRPRLRLRRRRSTARASSRRRGWARALALEVAQFGIQSVLVEPGMIRTSRWDEHRGTAARRARPGEPLPRPVRRERGDRRQDRDVVADPPGGRGRGDRRGAHRRAAEAALRRRPRRARRRPRCAGCCPSALFERLYFGGQLRRLERRTATGPAAPSPEPEPQRERVG